MFTPQKNKQHDKIYGSSRKSNRKPVNDKAAFEKIASQFKIKPYPEPGESMADVGINNNFSNEEVPHLRDGNPTIVQRADKDEREIVQKKPDTTDATGTAVSASNNLQVDHKSEITKNDASGTNEDKSLEKETKTQESTSNNVKIVHGELTTIGEGSNDETKYIHWPETQASGVTLGKGYDIGNRKREQIIEELTSAGMDEAQAKKIAEGAGKKGDDAENFVINNKSKIGEIAPSVQTALLANMLKEYTEKAKNIATSETPLGDNVNARGREVKEGVAKGTYVMTIDEWNGLHPAMVEFLTDLIYNGGYYAWDRVAKINKALKDNKGNHLEQFKAVRELFTNGYMDDYAKNIKETKVNKDIKETYFGQEINLKDKYRRNQIRLAFLNKVISALESGKIVEMVNNKAEVTSANNSTNKDTPITNKTQSMPELAVPKNFTKTYVVKQGETLILLAAKYKITVDQLKAANANKLKTWGTIQGFNAGESINVPEIQGNKAPIPIEKQGTAVETIASLYKSYSGGKINMPDFARGLLPYVKTNAKEIIDLFGKLEWSARDNFAYALAANSNESSLSGFDKNLLITMSAALDSFLTISRKENLKQKERIDKLLGTKNSSDKGKVENDGKGVYNKTARDEAIKFINDNKYAYLKGKEKWATGKRDGQAYNNILIVNKNIEEANNKNLKIYRKFSGGVYSYIDRETLNDTQYSAEISGTVANTYCNIAATKIGLGYDAPNLQNHKGTEHNANDIYDKLAKKYYDSDTHEFKNVPFSAAEQYAGSGGLAYAVYKNPSGKSGHIATLTGGYGNDGSAKMGNLNIFQAGSKFGAMTYSKGFGNLSSMFYIWKKK